MHLSSIPPTPSPSPSPAQKPTTHQAKQMQACKKALPQLTLAMHKIKGMNGDKPLIKIPQNPPSKNIPIDNHETQHNPMHPSFFRRRKRQKSVKA
jgi:hypothetical protein